MDIVKLNNENKKLIFDAFVSLNEYGKLNNLLLETGEVVYIKTTSRYNCLYTYKGSYTALEILEAALQKELSPINGSFIPANDFPKELEKAKDKIYKFIEKLILNQFDESYKHIMDHRHIYLYAVTDDGYIPRVVNVENIETMKPGIKIYSYENGIEAYSETYTI